MKVMFEGREYEFEGEMRVRDVIKKLNLNPEEIVVLKDGRPVTEDERIGKDEQIEIILVVSRG